MIPWNILRKYRNILSIMPDEFVMLSILSRLKDEKKMRIDEKDEKGKIEDGNG